MAYPRCAEIDILRNKLIETYREMSSTEISTISCTDDNFSNPHVSDLLGVIRDHKSSCMLCQRNGHAEREGAAADRPKYGKSA